MGRVISMERRLSALEAKAPQSPWDLDCLPDGDLENLARVLAGLEEGGSDLSRLPEVDHAFLNSVQERCWLGARA